MTNTISVSNVERSSTVETEGAVDAEVTYAGREYAVTLCPAEYDGTLSMWGQLDHWIAGEGIRDLSREDLETIETAVREAAEAAGLA